MKSIWISTLAIVLAITAVSAGAQEEALPSPPERLTAKDHPWDHGTRVDLTWSRSPDDPSRVTEYRIEVSDRAIGPFRPAGRVPAGTLNFTVEKLTRDQGFFFQVLAIGKDDIASEPVRTDRAVAPTRQGFDGSRFWLSVIILIFCGSVVFWISRARRGKPLKVRKIAGLEAVDEAVGRATEMGRSVLFVAGIQDMNDIQTIAGITVLARVSKIAAEFDAKVEVPTTRSLVMTAARETVQASYLAAGRPDAYNSDLIYYVTDEQFGYVAYLQGMMVREKPAACFYMGAFFAESLILAETGNTIGAIQIAGTAQPAQLPFFVAACDYTLIGEEFFAASAYLSGEPDQLGSLKGQDIGKGIVAVGIVFGMVLSSIAHMLGPDSALGTVLSGIVHYLREVILV
jgi:hypothetical protein